MSPSTSHSLAYRAVGKKYIDRLNGPRLPTRVVTEMLGIDGTLYLSNGKSLSPFQQSRLTSETVINFCHSNDYEIRRSHMPQIPGVDDEESIAELQDNVIEFAEEMWKDIQSKNGQMYFTHDHYLKIWAMDEPELDADFIFLDEAQDANPVLASVIMAQDAQLVLVGDRCQSIYGW